MKLTKQKHFCSRQQRWSIVLKLDNRCRREQSGNLSISFNLMRSPISPRQSPKLGQTHKQQVLVTDDIWPSTASFTEPCTCWLTAGQRQVYIKTFYKLFKGSMSSDGIRMTWI